ncbi:hypothetical protein Shyhy01_39930 [Streptomyces hygroscopicus subsp. hygroscopicus]|nr:hypothetical protein Shyhy01_39930 [Streptomyces hygroscopicus subsp. hygroscopicus]
MLSAAAPATRCRLAHRAPNTRAGDAGSLGATATRSGHSSGTAVPAGEPGDSARTPTSGADQRWRPDPDGTVTGVRSGPCPDITGTATGSGTRAGPWTRSGRKDGGHEAHTGRSIREGWAVSREILPGTDGGRGRDGGFAGAGVAGVTRTRARADLDADTVTGREPVEGRPQRHFHPGEAVPAGPWVGRCRADASHDAVADGQGTAVGVHVADTDEQACHTASGDRISARRSRTGGSVGPSDSLGSRP